ncbi:hypothetical protein [Streptomyces sp. NPDC059459]|uniref:hypothetical protein n=1 Tax=unclassified Streptomyces TaxID=2593676 RepID=UPI0036806C74
MSSVSDVKTVALAPCMASRPAHRRQNGVDGVRVPVQTGCLQHVSRHGDHLVVRVRDADPGQRPVPQRLLRRFARVPRFQGRERRRDDRDVEPRCRFDQRDHLPIAVHRLGKGF